MKFSIICSSSSDNFSARCCRNSDRVVSRESFITFPSRQRDLGGNDQRKAILKARSSGWWNKALHISTNDRVNYPRAAAEDNAFLGHPIQQLLERVGLGVSLSQHGVTQVWMGLSLSEAHWGLLCVWNREETRATKKPQKTPLQESQLLFAIQNLCHRGEKPSLALVSSAVTPLTLSQA